MIHIRFVKKKDENDQKQLQKMNLTHKTRVSL